MLLDHGLTDAGTGWLGELHGYADGGAFAVGGHKKRLEEFIATDCDPSSRY
jgi:hypothetical protein